MTVGSPGMNSMLPTARLLRRWATPAEQLLWQHLRARRREGHAFRRQHPIGPYIVNFVCRKRRLIIEVDGKGHEATIEYDQERTAYLRSQGFTVLRFSNSRVMLDTPAVLRDIKRYLARLQS